jgi:hypothetical protein
MTAAVQLHPSTHTPARTGAPTVTPQHRPSTPQMPARIVASVVLGLPSLAAIYGSAAALIHIASDEHLSDPRVLPFCLDLLAIGIVVSAVFCGHDDRLSRWTPWLAYGASAALQVADVWADGPRAWAVHALPLAAAILGTEKILRLWRPETTDHLEVDAEPEDATPAADEPAVALATVTAVRRPAAPKPTPTKKSTTGLDLKVVAKVRTALAEMGVTATDAKRDDVLAHLRRGGPAPHVSKVGPALRHLRENPDA